MVGMLGRLAVAEGIFCLPYVSAGRLVASYAQAGVAAKIAICSQNAGWAGEAAVEATGYAVEGLGRLPLRCCLQSALAYSFFSNNHGILSRSIVICSQVKGALIGTKPSRYWISERPFQ